MLNAERLQPRSETGLACILILAPPATATPLQQWLSDSAVVEVVTDRDTASQRLSRDLFDALVMTPELAGDHEAVRQMRLGNPRMALVAIECADQDAIAKGFDLGCIRPDGGLSVQILQVIARRRERANIGAGERRVLIAESDPDDAERLRSALDDAGFLVAVADSGASALQQLHRYGTHVFVADQTLTVGDQSVLSAARALDPTIAGVVLSANPCVETAGRAFLLGVLRFLDKAAHPDDIVAAIDKAWTRWAVGDQHRRGLLETRHSSLGTRVRLLYVTPTEARGRPLARLIERTPGDPIHVTLATTRTGAERCLAGGRTDVILADVGLGGTAARDMCIQLQMAAPDTPLLVMMDADDAMAREAAALCGGDVCLTRGTLAPDQLVDQIRFAAERRWLLSRLGSLASELHATYADQKRALRDNADGVVIVDDAGQVRFVNPAAEILLAQTPAELLGGTFPWKATPGAATDIALNGGIVEMRVSTTYWEGGDAQVISLRDATERRHAERRLETLNTRLREVNAQVEVLAHHDALTRLKNRRGLERVLFSELSRTQRSGQPLVAVLVDCDDFKRINDALGHAVGDAVLSQIAERIAATVRPTDHVARVGGDEFLILLPETRMAEAVSAAERIRIAIAEAAMVLSSDLGGVTASIGVAEVPLHVASIEELLSATHLALRKSKANGKNRVSVTGIAHEPDPDDPDAEDLSLAFSHGGCFTAVAQEIVSLGDEAIAGWEMLGRCTLPQAPMPLDFFRVAREQNLTTTVDLHCLRACVAAAAVLKQPANVNLLPSTLLDTPVEQLLDIFPKNGPGFVLELSEQQFIGDPSYLRAPVRALQEAGIRVALDDVGFGRSSLEALVMLEPDVVKVDRRYVDGVARSSSAVRRLRRLVGVVQALGADAVAEGIEQREDLELVRGLGIKFGQGFLWGRPHAV